MDPEESDPGFYSADAIGDTSNLEWLDELHALGSNPSAPGATKSFFTGVGFYWDYGEIHVSPGEDPNLPIDRIHDFANNRTGKPEAVFTVYFDWADNVKKNVFPVHRACYEELLHRCLKQHEDDKAVNRDILCSVFEDLNCAPWALVVDPVRIEQLRTRLDLIQDLLGDTQPEAQSSPKEDIFNRLPYELRNEIFNLLPSGSILALKAASWSMHTTALPDNIWKEKLRNEMPWFWEVRDIIPFKSQRLESGLSKILMDVAEKSQHTDVGYDPIPGLVNRRRIWGVCEQIRGLYLKKMEEVELLTAMG
ncbi:hypothetical protein EYZ11_010452 [Aspergillus tanneri]|uniref:F-box domain-containing protein n=1 Tax=Aspergillus tanneri TaxID=1220188 RepID=A0A4S3J7G3_9EURO|nr:hypothetical protein EYZ11_010452 [Aspergillus tanneri]